MMFKPSVFFLTCALTVLTLAVAPEPRFFFSENQWEIENIHFQRWNWSDPSNLGAIFHLYRSSYYPCNPDGATLISVLGISHKCNTWTIPDTPVSCTGGTRVYEEDPERTALGVSAPIWYTCNRHLRAVTGDEEVLPEKQKWLKWRLYDLKETGPMVPAEPGQAETIPFVSAKLEIVNGVPYKQAANTDAGGKVRVFTSVYEINREDVYCQTIPFAANHAQYSCVFKQASQTKRLLCESPFQINTMSCSDLVKVTEKNETLAEWNSRFSI